MKRFHFFLALLALNLFIALPFVLATKVQAQVACPSSQMDCSQLDAQGGCREPCTRVVTRPGGGRRGPAVPAGCTCQFPEAQQCEDSGGSWDEKKGVCTAKTAQTQGICITLRCPSGTIKKVIARDPTTLLGIACGCYEVLLQGPGIHLRPQECELNLKYDLGQVTYDTGIKTALGCIPYEPGSLVTWIFGVAVSVGGGIAFLIMAVGAFLFVTSAGNPEQIQKGKEMIVSAGAGLLFIIFSIFLLRLIGVDILKIPGFQ